MAAQAMLIYSVPTLLEAMGLVDASPVSSRAGYLFVLKMPERATTSSF